MRRADSFPPPAKRCEPGWGALSLTIAVCWATFPTPDPSPPRASARGGRDVERSRNPQTVSKELMSANTGCPACAGYDGSGMPRHFLSPERGGWLRAKRGDGWGLCHCFKYPHPARTQPSLRRLRKLALRCSPPSRASGGAMKQPHAAFASLPLKVSPSLSPDTTTVSPSLMWPARIISASGSCTDFWITRFNGRAP